MVEEEYRGRGLGRALVETVKQRYMCRKMYLSSVPESEGFWEKVGAKRVEFNDLPVVIRSHLDSWKHRVFKPFILESTG
jgi:GNAT superfamily N-acetyltransferase